MKGEGTKVDGAELREYIKTKKHAWTKVVES